MKKTDCPSKLTITVLVPSKKNQLASDKKPYLTTHPTVLRVTFNHNHPLTSAHALSFRPISQETRESYIELFRKGHTAASAHHWHETKLYLDQGEDQSLLADRASNPTKSDISRLYSEWQKKELGDDNGKGMFDKLQCEIDAYNDACGEYGGKAKVQLFQGVQESESDSSGNESDSPPKKKRRKVEREMPMILTVCTPLMCRVHEHIQQAGEMIFCDSTSTLDRFNTSLFILSTSHPAGGLPLAIMITSDEQEETLVQGLNQLTEVLPMKAFYGRGASKGPLIAMTDDSSAERNALHSVWPDSWLLLCTFHFLQRKWTWLHDGNNRIADADRAFLINKTKHLVYTESETILFRLYDDFQKCSIVNKYPNYLSYIRNQWDRRKEWALCYRKYLLVRGNQTNNYAEAGMRILKDLVFSRVKAYNLVQMFSFVTECLELYYSRKILSVAHNRFDHHISLKFQGLKCSGISESQIELLDEANGTYLVSSLTERRVKYLVDMKVGVCSCKAGQDGSLCSHQAAIVKHFHIPSVNCIPTLSPEIRQLLAMIAIGPQAEQNHNFYTSLHQKKYQLNLHSADSTSNNDTGTSEFVGTAWDLMRCSAMDTQTEEPCNSVGPGNSSPVDIDDLVKQIKDFTEDITARVRTNSAVAQGMQTFLRRYNSMTESGQFHNARLSSALHRFGWVFGGNIKSTQGGYLRRGRRIPVNALSAGRRRKSKSKGKEKLPPGRPKGMKIAVYPPSRYIMPNRKQAPGKRLHSLKNSIQHGKQNAGKW